MNTELPQPFDQEDIRKDPKAVVIGLLIGLLLISLSAIIYLFDTCEKKDNEIVGLYEKIIVYRTAKAEYYEQLNRLRYEREARLKIDTLLKEKTEPLVKEILK